MGTTKLERLLLNEGGVLSRKELKIIKQKENDNGRKQSVERGYSVQESPQEHPKGIRTKGRKQAVYFSEEY